MTAGHFGTTQDVATSCHLFSPGSNNVNRSQKLGPRSTMFPLSHSRYKIQKKGFRHVEEYCLMCARGMSYNMDPPGRHWLDLDIQHSWHRKSSSTSKNVFQPTSDQLSELRACSVTDKQSDFSLVKSFVGNCGEKLKMWGKELVCEEKQ